MKADILQLGGSLIWDIIHVQLGDLTGVYTQLQAGGDLLAFLGFLAMLITNGVVASDLYYNNISKVMLLAYNSFPWIVCA